MPVGKTAAAVPPAADAFRKARKSRRGRLRAIPLRNERGKSSASLGEFELRPGMVASSARLRTDPLFAAIQREDEDLAVDGPEPQKLNLWDAK
jgi:hypothetical protein